jgi:hypothetical protein
MKYQQTLNHIYSNEVVFETLKSFFNDVAEENKPALHGQNDEELGQQFRAYCKAKEIIEDAFLKLHSMDASLHSTNGIRYK